jgi:hypothetical protein
MGVSGTVQMEHSYDRGARGKLLWQPQWAEEGRRFTNWSLLPFAIGIGALATWMSIYIVKDWGLLTENGIGGGLVLLFLLMALGVLAFLFLTAIIRTMPFRVYERGVTMEEVSLRDGWARRERFVPAYTIKRVWLVRTSAPRGVTVSMFRFERTDPKVLKNFNASVDDDELGHVSDLLRFVLPGKVDSPHSEEGHRY